MTQIQILIVSPDRKLLRRSAEFLGACGFLTIQATNESQAKQALLNTTIDMILVDHNLKRSISLLQSRAHSLKPYQHTPFAFLLVEQRNPDTVLDALSCGADDLLSKPLRYTELLVRIRAAARFMELESRIHQKLETAASYEAVGFTSLCYELHQVLKKFPQSCCQVIEIDYLDSILEELKPTAKAELKATVHQWLSQQIPSEMTSIEISDSKLGLINANQSIAECYNWLESLRIAFAQHKFYLDSEEIQLTFSAAIVTQNIQESTPELMVAKAQHYLDYAHLSGHNMVAYLENVEESASAHSLAASSESLFEETTAIDMMRPCTLKTTPDQLYFPILQKMQVANLEVVPVMDQNNQLLGIIQPANTPVENLNPESTVDFYLIRDYPNLPHHTRFEQLIQHFSELDIPWVLIHEQNQPLGIVHRADLALLSEPIDRTSYAVSKLGNEEQRFVIPEVTPAGV